MYGMPPVYGFDIAGFALPSFKGNHHDDRKKALQHITARADKMRVVIPNTAYVLNQTVLVQLCSRAKEARGREWCSAAKIIGVSEPDYVQVKYLNTNYSRPEGYEERVPVKQLCPLVDDVDMQASIQAGEIVHVPHKALHTRDTRVYVDKILMSRKLDHGKNEKNETSYLVMFSGNSLLQVKWVWSEDLLQGQLSHVEKLV